VKLGNPIHEYPDFGIKMVKDVNGGGRNKISGKIFSADRRQAEED
jgi:hypothetical protein